MRQDKWERYERIIIGIMGIVAIASIFLLLSSCSTFTEGDKQVLHQVGGAGKYIVEKAARGSGEAVAGMDVIKGTAHLGAIVGLPAAPQPYIPEKSMGTAISAAEGERKERESNQDAVANTVIGVIGGLVPAAGIGLSLAWKNRKKVQALIGGVERIKQSVQSGSLDAKTFEGIVGAIGEAQGVASEIKKDYRALKDKKKLS